MEWVEVVKDFISTLGFPIVCCGAMFWEMDKTRQSHAEESTRWVDALNRNTDVIEKISDKLEEK